MVVVEQIARALMIAEEAGHTYDTFQILREANWEVCVSDDAPANLDTAYLSEFPLVIVVIQEEKDVDNLHSIVEQCASMQDTYVCAIIEADCPVDYTALPVCHFLCTGNSDVVTMQVRGMLRVVQSQLKLHEDKQSLERINKNLAANMHKGERYSTSQILTEAIVQNVRHELATPVLQVKSAFKHMHKNKGKREVSDFAQQAIGRLETIVDNVSMIGSSLNMRRGPAMLHEIVMAMKRELPRHYTTQGELDRLIVDVSASLPPVYVDKKGIEIVLRQLVDNALKFSKSEIILSANELEQGVIVSIEDRGIGIESKKLAKIFDMFYQADLSTTKAYSGIGVGLTLVRHVLAEHESEIHVESKLGEGSTFSFLLEPVQL